MTRRRCARLAATALAVAATALGPAVLGPAALGPVGLDLAPTASAHPLGAPQTVHISTDDDRIVVRWSAAPDDLTALALHLGVLQEARSFVYDEGALVPEESDASDAVALAAAPRFRAYLLEHVRVNQSGEPCRGTVRDTGDLTENGARLAFSCPQPVSRVRVHVSTLTDIHPAYRTLASSSGGQRATYTVDARQHQWRLGAESEPRWVGAGMLGVGILVTGGGVVYLLVRRRRSTSRPESAG